MKIKRIILSTLALSLCVGSLVSCGSKKNPNSQDATSVKTSTKKVSTSKTSTSKSTSTSVETSTSKSTSASTTTSEVTDNAYSFVTEAIKDTDELAITSFVKNTSQNHLDTLVVPDEIDGKPVTKIKYNAFASGFYTIEIDKIVFGKNLKEINFHYFDLNRIKSVEISSENEYYKVVGDSILSADGKTFVLALNQEELTIPSTVETIGSYSLNTVSSSVLNGYELPSNIKTIEDSALTKNVVDTIILNEGLTTVEDRGLYVKNIIMPKSLVNIRPQSFYEVENISVASGNEKYNSQDNCVIETATNELVAVGLNYKIPSTVKSIGYGVFSYTNRFTSITIPNTVKTISGTFAFAFCSNLETLVLPSDIKFENSSTGVGINYMNFAIEGCSKLKSFNIPETVTYLYATDLFGLGSLEYLYIPAITKIDKDVFKNTPKLTRVKINLTQAQWEALEYEDTSDKLKYIGFEFKS
jgi:hypothetical protein